MTCISKEDDEFLCSILDQVFTETQKETRVQVDHSDYCDNVQPVEVAQQMPHDKEKLL